MHALDERREVEEAAGHERDLERWLAASKPLAVDDDPDWDHEVQEAWLDDRAE